DSLAFCSRCSTLSARTPCSSTRYFASSCDIAAPPIKSSQSSQSRTARQAPHLVNAWPRARLAHSGQGIIAGGCGGRLFCLISALAGLFGLFSRLNRVVELFQLVFGDQDCV